MPRKDVVPNLVFRQRFQELEWSEGLTLAEVAHRVGWVAKDSRNGRDKPDSSRVARTLGLMEETISRDGQKITLVRESMSYENAALMCRALHLDPVEAGI